MIPASIGKSCAKFFSLGIPPVGAMRMMIGLIKHEQGHKAKSWFIVNLYMQKMDRHYGIPNLLLVSCDEKHGS